MKSIYQDKEFANYWNNRAGETGEPFKRFVLDPVMLKVIGNLQGKDFLELGCGNGYLAPKILEQNPKTITMLDISPYNLAFAKEKTSDPRVVFLEQDATQVWKVDTESVDVVYSNMMLNEIEDSATLIKEVFRVTRKGGFFVFSVTHPAWDLYVFAQEKVGISSGKIKDLGNYFRRGKAKFIMGGHGDLNPGVKEKYEEETKEFEVEHYQRPISDYFNKLTEIGFVVHKIFEPELTEELLIAKPRYESYKDHPIGLIFYCSK